MTWDDMTFWQSGEWQVIEERLDDLEEKATKLWGKDARNFLYNPAREDIFAALDACPLDKVKVAIFGQDPYPKKEYATGIAFSIPKKAKTLPPTLVNIFQEYSDDLHYDAPVHGNIAKWANRGVLLWNCFPVCLTDKPGSARWPEWDCLNAEIIEKLNERCVVFVLLGASARKFAGNNPNVRPLAPYIDDRSIVIEASHPSPLGARAKNNPFLGSRIFTRINDALVQSKKEPIDWKL